MVSTVVQEEKKMPKKHRKQTILQTKMHKVMHEFATHHLHSGSKNGPIVTNRRQALAITFSEARKRGAHTKRR